MHQGFEKKTEQIAFINLWNSLLVMQNIEYILASVFLVSIISLIGVSAIGMQEKKLQKVLMYLVSFSAGALFGDAFIHLIPEIIESYGFSVFIGVLVLAGIFVFFIIEKFIHWHHCHTKEGIERIQPFTYMNLIGDGAHNFLDGLIIAGSYIVSIPLGIATTIAVILHEIPQEIGDFGVLIYGGLSKNKAISLNFVSALTAFLGAGIAVSLHGITENLSFFILPFTVGGFIYIAGSDLLPQLQKETKVSISIWQLIAFVLGVAVMLSLLVLGA